MKPSINNRSSTGGPKLSICGNRGRRHETMNLKSRMSRLRVSNKTKAHLPAAMPTQEAIVIRIKTKAAVIRVMMSFTLMISVI